MTGVVR